MPPRPGSQPAAAGSAVRAEQAVRGKRGLPRLRTTRQRARQARARQAEAPARSPRQRTGTGAGAVGADAAPDSMNARMSFFVTRPPWPVPGIPPGSTPCWAAIRATTGETNVRPFPSPAGASTGAPATTGSATSGSLALDAGSAGASATGSASGCAACGSSTSSCSPAGAGVGSGGAASPPAGRMSARTVPTSTVSPSWTRISATTPSPGLGTSVSTLSVEISSSGSSREMASPACLSQRVTVPSDTDTPIWGITTSTSVPVLTRQPPGS